MLINDGWLNDSIRYQSPNQDERPPGCTVELLVIHGISLPAGEFGGPWVTDLFMNRLPADAHPSFANIHQMRVSAHVLIRRDGEIIQFVPFNNRAWHAGVSSFNGRDRCNDFSIGIELEGSDNTPYTDQQYTALTDVTLALMRQYAGIELDNIVGHSDIAPGRKTDPGPNFDWRRFRVAIGERLHDSEDP